VGADGRPERRRRRSPGGALLLLWLLAGCHAKRPETIIVISPTGGLEYWESFDHAVQAAAAADGVRTDLAAPQSVTDYEEQAQMLDDAIARHVQGIIVAPSHQLVLTSVLRRASQAHIPVVLIGLPVALPDKDYVAFLDCDQEEEGRLGARRLMALLGGKGEVGVVGVSPTVEGSSLIEKGFAEEIARSPRVKLVSVKYGLSDWARGRQAVLDLVTEHPQIKGIFTTDEFSTNAAARVFEGSGRKRPLLIGVSQEANELEALRRGAIDALVVSDPQELGVRAMQAMHAALARGDAGAYSTELPVHIVDRKTMESDPVMRSVPSAQN
jgi:ribose transport system substrate-binding protein